MQDNITEQQLSETPVTDGMNHIEGVETGNADGSNSYGRFKSADSLYEAYRQLEKEFTKKSQQLREYQRANNVSDTVEDILAVNPGLVKYADELRNSITTGANPAVKLAECLVGRVNEPCHIINDREFLDKYVYQNKDITDRVIERYLDSLQNSGESVTIKGRGNAYVSPSYRPRTLSEANRLATKYIENRRI